MGPVIFASNHQRHFDTMSADQIPRSMCGACGSLSATANRRAYRAGARAAIERFIDVYVDGPLEVCIARDPKGIYRKVQSGQASTVPGVQASYEAPEHADVVVSGHGEPPETGAHTIGSGFACPRSATTSAWRPLARAGRAWSAKTWARQSLELVIVQDLFLTETAREFGSVFLPACSSFEKDGTFMNAERRIQRVRAALRPAGEAKPDWRIIAEIARAMGGRGFEYHGHDEIWDEVWALSPGARGMTYARLETSGLQWPCPAEDHPGTPILHREAFASGPHATLRCVEHRATPE